MESSTEKKVDTTMFWHVVLPILTLIILFAVLFIIYTLPDWALTCRPASEMIRRAVSS
jgi:hypothetical protein